MDIDRALLQASWQSWIGGRRERVGPWWLQWVWTVLFCAVLAVGFTILGFVAYARDADSAWRNWAGWAEWYGRNFVTSLTIGVLIHLAFDLARPLTGGGEAIRRWPAWKRTAFYTLVPLGCTFIGWPLGLFLQGVRVAEFELGPQPGNVIVGTVLLALLMTVLFHQFFALKARQHDAERRAAEAQLRLLQGQIEPHFLFNTLAGVLSLIDHDPPKAKQMLHDFTEYLRCSLGALRSGESPLAQELDLAENYLRLMGSRMEGRLRWRIDADEAARRVHVPPLLLQPLIENAIHHGLEPQLQGGTVTVSAQRVGGELVLQVHDDGRGLDAPPRLGVRAGPGVALANIRSRLQSRYGSLASLGLQPAQPGTLAVIRLPVAPTSATGEHA